MKELYEELELELIRFRMADIITTSDARDEDDDMDDEPDDGDDDTGDDDPTTSDGGLTANPDGTYTDGVHTYTPTGENVPDSDGNSYPEYLDESHNAYVLKDGEMVGPLV